MNIWTSLVPGFLKDWWQKLLLPDWIIALFQALQNNNTKRKTSLNSACVCVYEKYYIMK